MLQGIIIKKVLDLVMKQILKKFNLDKIQKYVDEPNELEKAIKLSPSKKDDVLWDMVLKPIVDKIKGK